MPKIVTECAEMEATDLEARLTELNKQLAVTTNQAYTIAAIKILLAETQFELDYRKREAEKEDEALKIIAEAFAVIDLNNSDTQPPTKERDGMSG